VSITVASGAGFSGASAPPYPGVARLDICQYLISAAPVARRHLGKKRRCTTLRATGEMNEKLRRHAGKSPSRYRVDPGTLRAPQRLR
jgi:hypothetical protein